MKKDRRISRGIWWTTYGWRFYVRVRGTLKPKRVHDPDHLKTLEDLKDLRAKWRVDAGGKKKVAPSETPSTFAPRVDNDYLPSVTSMPSYTDRARDMARWSALFGEREPDTITPLEIKKQLEAWRAAGAAPSTANKRRTALMSFFTAINGKSGYNPVRDVAKYDEDEEPHDHPLWTLYRVLACMRPSATRARLRVFLWTGWPHKQLKQLKAEHVDYVRARAHVTRRRKGKGHAAVWLPLLPGALVALKDLATRKGFGPFSNASLRKSLLLAVKKYNAHRRRFGHAAIRVRPYDFRHSFGTWVADHLEDDRVLQELMLHSKREQSVRYSRRATERRLERGMARLREVTSGGPGGNFLPENGETPGKSGGQKSRRPHETAQSKWRGRRGSNSRPPA